MDLIWHCPYNPLRELGFILDGVEEFDNSIVHIDLLNNIRISFAEVLLAHKFEFGIGTYIDQVNSEDFFFVRHGVGIHLK
jgi:hypothetical protein